MELWFIAAIGGAIFHGLANFVFKIAAKRDYYASQFSFYGGIASLVIMLPIALLFSDFKIVSVWAGLAAFGAGCLGGFNNIGKVKALQYIDSTIYFPLFKLVSPALAIVFGMLAFGERFSATEWFGLILTLMVPLLLITHSEQGRQNNLWLGITFVLFTGLFAALGSLFNKYAIEVAGNVLLILVVMSLGIIFGSLLADYYKGGSTAIRRLFQWQGDRAFLGLAILRSALITTGVGLIIFAYGNGGSLGVVHSINSMYILIPIVLAIIFYNEHWNWQKATAIVLSVASLALLG